jgi:hypothetical protein
MNELFVPQQCIKEYLHARSKERLEILTVTASGFTYTVLLTGVLTLLQTYQKILE